MLNRENQVLCWELLKRGVHNQMMMVIEECAELQKAVCKLFRDDLSPSRTINLHEAFVEELIDVIVVCQQMLLANKITMEEVNRRAHEKLTRALNNTST